jgi:carbamoyl-phosphate synthase large subunit
MRTLERYFKVYPGGLTPAETASCCLAGRKRFVPLPRTGDASYGAELLTAVKRIGIEVVLPVRNEDMAVLEALRDDLGHAGAVLVQSPPETVEVCTDKLLLYERLRNSGISTPDTCVAHDYEGISATDYPIFVKPRQGSGSRHAQAVWTSEELDHLLQGHPDLIVQPFIKGQEYTVDMFFNQGRRVQYVVRKRLSVAGGQMDAGEVVADLDLDSFREAVDIGKHLIFHGPINMQFILKDEICWVTDVNPRFSGGIGLTIAAGCDFPRYLLALVAGREIATTSPVIGTRAISYTDYVYA